jgi:dGTPase
MRPALAPYACRADSSRGRLHREPESATRSVFQRDRDRIIHSGAFRRLQYKTQVFVYHEGDFYRTRLTHSVEVSQIARSISRQLGLDEDLAEGLALAHDLGHTCFGHAGEDALNLAMTPFGGFSHNEQTFRIVTRLERRYAAFDGLNLTWETLEGLVKHNGPLLGPRALPRDSGGPVPAGIAEFCKDFDLKLETYASVEAQIAALADDIAYNNHDIDDGLRAGLFSVPDLDGLPLIGPVFREVASHHPGLDDTRMIHESVRRLIDHMVNDLLAETRRRLEHFKPGSVEDVRDLDQPMAGFSEEMRKNDRALRKFLFKRMYRHPRVNHMADKARRIVSDLFAHYMSQPQRLPDDWERAAGGLAEAERARLVADYIAGMTDRFAFKEHALINSVHVEQNCL